MRHIIFVLVAILVPALAAAAETQITVSTQSVGIVTHDGRSLEIFTMDLDDLTAGDLLEASLELKVRPEAPAGARFVEVQVAAWVTGEPIVPAGRSGYVAEITADRGEDTAVFLDITPILADALETMNGEPSLVVGAIDEETLPGATVIPWDQGQGVWGIVRIHHR
jgi:hypothetical protein